MEEIKSSDRQVILAIDDMGINLRAVKVALEAYFEVRLAKSGELGLSILRSEKIDLILLDVEMPEMSGFDFMYHFKNDSQLDKPPVIFVTAQASPELVARVKLAGVNGYVLKPFDPEILLKRVQEVLGIADAPQ